MAPKGVQKSSVSLVSFVPTDEELKQARSMLSGADAKARKSKTNSMNAFLAANSDDKQENAKVLKMAAGPEKTEYVVKYMAYQSAKKAGRLSLTRTNAVENAKMKDTLRWNAWKCKQEVGEDTFAEWKDSGKLPYDPDPVTGSVAEHMRVYLVPVI